jgi:hypothetical protein
MSYSSRDQEYHRIDSVPMNEEELNDHDHDQVGLYQMPSGIRQWHEEIGI